MRMHRLLGHRECKSRPGPGTVAPLARGIGCRLARARIARVSSREKLPFAYMRADSAMRCWLSASTIRAVGTPNAGWWDHATSLIMVFGIKIPPSYSNGEEGVGGWRILLQAWPNEGTKCFGKSAIGIKS